MREPEQAMGPSLPRPGRALKIVLATLAAVSVLGAIINNWAPGPPTGPEILHWVVFDLTRVLTRPWTLLTSGLVTSPNSMGHIIYALIGLYFLTPDLERRWGAARLVRFLVASVVVGNLLALLVDKLPFTGAIFHPVIAFGPGAAIAATAIAWSIENRHGQIRLFFFVPASGRVLFWVTIGFCVLGLVYYQQVPESAFAPFGGVLVGVLLTGNPSPVRSLYLRAKLALLRRKGGITMTAADVAAGIDRPRAAKRRAGGPPLRVVQGGLEEELKNRKPPKDKRHLN